jgi:hypothetical protein
MSVTIQGRPPYTKRPTPFSYTGDWLAVEFGNIQRAIPPQLVRIAYASEKPSLQDRTVLYDASGGAITVTLPDPSLVQGIIWTFKKWDNSLSTVTLVGVVDGITNPVLSAQYDAVTIQAAPNMYAKLGGV